jgi:hypothetical protein
MARIVTGSVAESVEPNIRHSSRVSEGDMAAGAARVKRYVKTLSERGEISIGYFGAQRQPYPMPTAEIKVPTKANVRIDPKFRKNWSYGSS